MGGLSGLEKWAWYAGIGLSLAVIVRLQRLGIAGRYNALTCFLIVSSARSIVLALLPFGSDRYAEAYLYSAPILYLSYSWLVLHIYGHAFHSYKGIAALGRLSIFVALVAGAALASLTTLLDHNAAREPFPFLGLVFKLEAIVTKTLVTFLLMISAVLAWFPIPQRRNLLLIGFGVTALFVTLTASHVVRGLNPSAWTRLGSTSSLYVFAGCMAMWLFGLKSKSKDVAPATPLPATGEGEAALAGQLRAMNQALESLRKLG